ncbi:periplasmic heavy metal sensor [Thalassovita taeanensis]|uniref:Heavy-metal resistance n=1 Tax=Thalassovita taeanensis TaxID=657014 RepID=A0A1H9ERK8_9RHOB|nr:periplasmic heavy metal sensor [Thalassovita taeanensis]SEQ27638.1 Heavy-metal resistance [Thalassovita taeanensis]
MTPQDDSAPKGRTKRFGWMQVMLFASLALNLAVAGLVIGSVLTHGHPNGRRPPRMVEVAGPYTHALSRADRREIIYALRSEYREGRPSREQIRDEFNAVIAALRAVPYDPGRVAAIVERQMAVGMDRQELGQRLLLERLAAMNDAERAGFADRLAEALEHRSEWGRHSDDSDDNDESHDND